MPGFKTKQESIAIAGAADLLIRSLVDRQQFHDPQLQAEKLGISSASWPLFGLLWPSSLQLAMRMAVRDIVANETILEIGCGLALPSLVAHRRGADVTASDRHPLAASFLRRNLQLNGLPPMKYRHENWSSGQPAARYERGFDLVIGSDLLYERDTRGDLATLVDRVASVHAEVWIVDPDRDNRAPFTRGMRDRGFDCSELRLDLFKGRLLVYKRGT
jgi:predicted nicotinamide N-methyase